MLLATARTEQPSAQYGTPHELHCCQSGVGEQEEEHRRPRGAVRALLVLVEEDVQAVAPEPRAHDGPAGEAQRGAPGGRHLAAAALSPILSRR